ncbi:MAG: hypothetical protein ACT4PZ_12410 [Panacagrimonas sp.]
MTSDRLYVATDRLAVNPAQTARGALAGWLASHNQKGAEGFIRLNGLRLRTGAKRDQP